MKRMFSFILVMLVIASPAVLSEQDISRGKGFGVTYDNVVFFYESLPENSFGPKYPLTYIDLGEQDYRQFHAFSSDNVSGGIMCEDTTDKVVAMMISVDDYSKKAADPKQSIFTEFFSVSSRLLFGIQGKKSMVDFMEFVFSELNFVLVLSGTTDDIFRATSDGVRFAIDNKNDKLTLMFAHPETYTENEFIDYRESTIRR